MATKSKPLVNGMSIFVPTRARDRLLILQHIIETHKIDFTHAISDESGALCILSHNQKSAIMITVLSLAKQHEYSTSPNSISSEALPIR